MQVRSLGWENPLRRKWRPTPIFLPGKPHEPEELGRLQSQRLRHYRATEHTSIIQSRTAVDPYSFRTRFESYLDFFKMSF